MTESDQTTVEAVSRDGRTFTLRCRRGRADAGRRHRRAAGQRTASRSWVRCSSRDRRPGRDGSAPGGSGLLIGVVGEDGALRRTLGGPFASASVEPASEAHLEALQRASCGIAVHRHLAAPCGVGVDARLRAQGFGRHTFLCGQSGSGKTYALGVILEQLLLNTELRMVVLDPNADFVRLGQARPEAPADAADRLAKTDVRVLGADATGAEPLRMRFATMPRQAQAAVLRLDPLADRGEYNHFLHMMDEPGPKRSARSCSTCRQGGAGRAVRSRSGSRTSGCRTGRCGPASSRRRPRWCRAAPASPCWTSAASAARTSRTPSAWT